MPPANSCPLTHSWQWHVIWSAAAPGVHVCTVAKLEVEAAAQKEAEVLRKKVHGWSTSLANPDLSLSVRGVLERDLDQALDQLRELEQRQGEADASQERRRIY